MAKGKKKEPKGPQGSQWVQQAGRAYDEAHRALPAGQTPEQAHVETAVLEVAQPTVAGGSISSGAGEVPISQARMGALMMHRHSGEGLMATGFEPERHSVVVLGRPVQASPPSIACKAAMVVSFSVFLVIHPMAAGFSVFAPPSCRLPCCVLVSRCSLPDVAAVYQMSLPFAPSPARLSCHCKLSVC